jgi:5-(carboxyamino)imidazole ribonucleotide synthase
MNSVQKVVGVIGGGQLARMMHPAAIAMGIELRVFAETENSSAHAAATKVGDYTNLDELREFCKGVDALSFDHEHVPVALLAELECSGVAVRPGFQALLHAQNKLVMRKKLATLELPMPAWQEIKTVVELENFIALHGPEVIVKTPIGGYDGKGVRVVSEVSQVADWFSQLDSIGGALLAEQKISFTRELAILSARNPSGEFKTWPLVQTTQISGVCAEVIAPAPGSPNIELAIEIARSVSEGLGVVGVLAVELFETSSGDLFINELAMRPHNSGHFSIEGSTTSQFEQHLRAVLDLPLGETALAAKHAVMLNLLGVDDKNTFVERYQNAMAIAPNTKFHSYEKSARRGRKMGHLTIVGNDLESMLKEIRSAYQVLTK